MFDGLMVLMFMFLFVLLLLCFFGRDRCTDGLEWNGRKCFLQIIMLQNLAGGAFLRDVDACSACFVELRRTSKRNLKRSSLKSNRRKIERLLRGGVRKVK